MPTPTPSSRRAPGRRPLKSPLAVATDYNPPIAANLDGRPYEEKTINAYVAPGKNLDVWLTARRIDGDFTVVDTSLLKRYFRVYYLGRGQGGTRTLQRNLVLRRGVGARMVRPGGPRYARR